MGDGGTEDDACVSTRGSSRSDLERSTLDLSGSLRRGSVRAAPAVCAGPPLGRLPAECPLLTMLQKVVSSIVFRAHHDVRTTLNQAPKIENWLHEDFPPV